MDLITTAAQFAHTTLESEGSGHDWWHIHRVHAMALRLAEEEGADTTVVSLAALLHDVWDHKWYDGDGAEAARQWLLQQGTDAELANHVHLIISRVSYKGAGIPDDMPTLEGRCVQDADRLDAIGAIGIARTFAYGGSKGRLLYDPSVPPEMHTSFEAYKGTTAPTINHFYEKLLLLKDRIHTSSGKRIAEERHAFMEPFFEQLEAEMNGDRPVP